MTEGKKSGKACFYYEMFMERAYGRYETSIPGTHSCLMQTLINAEKGKVISLATVAQFEEQLIEIKKHIEDAIDQYMAKPKVSKKIADELMEYKNQVVWSVSSDELMDIVLKVIDLTVSIPIEME